MENKSNQYREDECPACVGTGVQQSDSDGPPTFGVEPCAVCGGAEVKPGPVSGLTSNETIYEFRLTARNKYQSVLVIHSSFRELDDSVLLSTLASFWKLWTEKAVGVDLAVTRVTMSEATPLPTQSYVQLIAKAAR